MIDEIALFAQFKNAAKFVFNEYRRQLGEASIIGYAVVFDSTPTSFYPAVATKQDEARFCANQGCPASDYLFCPDEWNPDEIDQDGISKLVSDYSYPVIQKINDLYDECEDYDFDENWHEIYRTRVFSIGAQVLASLVMDGYFGTENERDGIFLMPWVSDSQIGQTYGRAWSKRLNAKKMNGRFNQWLDEKSS